MFTNFAIAAIPLGWCEHHFGGLPGSPFVRASFPLTFTIVGRILMHLTIKGVPFVKNNLDFLYAMALLMIMTEDSIYKNPYNFEVSSL